MCFLLLLHVILTEGLFKLFLAFIPIHLYVYTMIDVETIYMVFKGCFSQSFNKCLEIVSLQICIPPRLIYFGHIVFALSICPLLCLFNCLSAKNLVELLYFTCGFLVVRHFHWCQGQGHL